jgi:hypothetical protein
MTTVETPFGVMEMIAYRTNHCRLQCVSGSPIKVNRVPMRISPKEFMLIDGEWTMVECNNTDYYKNPVLYIHYVDGRQGDPSYAAREKLLQWIHTFFIADLNRGVYTTQLDTGELNYWKNTIQKIEKELEETLTKVDQLKENLGLARFMLNNLEKEFAKIP